MSSLNFSTPKSAPTLLYKDHLSWTFRSLDAEGQLRRIRRFKHSISAADRIRIERSIGILRGIKHPQISSLIDSTTETIDGLELLSLELEWVEGTLLQQVVAAQRPTLDTIIAWCASLLSLLEYLHGLQPRCCTVTFGPAIC